MKAVRKIWIISHCVGFTLYRLVMFLITKARGRLDKDGVAHFCVEWSKRLLEMANAEIIITGAPISQSPALLVGNHVSYLDIPAVMSQVYAVFVSKKEVAHWPVFGQAATAVGTIYVDRGSYDSRKSVALAIGGAIAKNNRCICLFPEGTSSVWGRAWKRGSFQIAQRYKFPVQAFALKYSPNRACAFIDDDALLPHMWNLLGEGKITIELEFKEVQYIEDSTEDYVKIQDWVQSRVRDFLINKEGLSPPVI